MKFCLTLLPGFLFLLLGVSALSASHPAMDTDGLAVHPTANYDSLYATAVPLSDSAEGRTLIDSCFRRYGGLDKLASIKSLQIKYRMKSFELPDSVDVIRCFQIGRKHLFARSHKVRILNGDKAWSGNRGTLNQLGDTRHRAELFSYLTLAMPLAIKTEPFDDIRYGTRSGDPLAYFYMDKRDSLLIVIGIDPEDSLLKSSEGVIRDGGQCLVFVNKFSDHREKDGIPFPHRVVTIAMGVEVGNSCLRSIELNPDFTEGLFDPSGQVKTRSGEGICPRGL